MILHDFGKLAVIALLLVGIFAAVLTEQTEFDQALPLLTAIVGYLFGNGVVAARGRAPSPMIVPKVEPTDVATTTGTVNVDELHQLAGELQTRTDEPPPARTVDLGELPRRAGEHTTGEHFLRPDWPPPRPEDPPAAGLWQIPLNPMPPYDVGPMPIDPVSLDDVRPSQAGTADLEPVDFGQGDIMCRCGHPRFHHIESESHPGTFLWCNNTSPAIAAGTVEARCACDLFTLSDQSPDNAEFWRRAHEESHGQAPR